MTNSEDVQASKDKRLMDACAGGEGTRVAWLLGKGANANAKDSHGVTALMYSVLPNSRPSNYVIKLLIANRADVNAKIKETGRTVLMMAAQNEYVSAVKLLIKAGADVSAEDNSHKNVLQLMGELSSSQTKENIINLLKKEMQKIEKRKTAADDSAYDRPVGTVMPSEKSGKTTKSRKSKTQKDQSH